MLVLQVKKLAYMDGLLIIDEPKTLNLFCSFVWGFLFSFLVRSEFMNEKTSRFSCHSVGLCCFLFDSLPGVAPKRAQAFDL